MTHKVRNFASYNQTFVVDPASKVLLSSQTCDTAVPPANIFTIFAAKRFGVVQRTHQGACKLTMRGLLAKLRTKRNTPLSVGPFEVQAPTLLRSLAKAPLNKILDNLVGHELCLRRKFCNYTFGSKVCTKPERTVNPYVSYIKRNIQDTS